MTARLPMSATSPAQPTAPDEWIEKRFAWFAAMWGSKFADLWRGCNLAEVKALWAKELSALTPEERARGYAACRTRDWPPTLPEFLKLCRPPVDFESAYREAVEQMAKRDMGADTWLSPAIFWAAVTIGAFELRNSTWNAIEKRWRRVLQAELDKGEWPPIPPRALAIEAPKVTPATSEAVAQRLAAIGLRAKEEGNKAWALRIEQQALAGEPVAYMALTLAEEALGKQLPRKSRAYRPDHMDRAAGDDSFGPLHEPAEGVPL